MRRAFIIICKFFNLFGGNYSENYLLFSLLYSSIAFESWSGQEVPFLHSVPFKTEATSSISLPSQSFATPCKFPRQPPTNERECILLFSSTSNSINCEHVPLVLYLNIKLLLRLIFAENVLIAKIVVNDRI